MAFRYGGEQARFDDYLKHAIGRNADASLKNLERPRGLISSFEQNALWPRNDLAELALLYKEQSELQDRVTELRMRAIIGTNWRLSCPITGNRLRIASGLNLCRRIEKQIEAVRKLYGLKIEQMTEFGKQIRQTQEMMTTITVGSQEFYSNSKNTKSGATTRSPNQFPLVKVKLSRKEMFQNHKNQKLTASFALFAIFLLTFLVYRSQLCPTSATESAHANRGD